MKNASVLAIAFFLLSACAGEKVSAYRGASEKAASTADKMEKIIGGAMATVHRDSRVQQLENLFIEGNREPNSDDFVEFVCRGYKALPEPRAGLSVLKQYYKHVGEILKEPKAEIGALYDSIQKLNKELKDGPPELKWPDIGKDFERCESEVAGLIAMRLKSINEAGIPGIDVISTLKSTLETLYTAMKTVAILALKEVDDSKRDVAFTSYVLEVNMGISEAIAELKAPDTRLRTDCSFDGAEKAPFCQAAANGISKLDATLVRRNWAALRLPYRRYLQMADIVSELREKKLYATIIQEGLKIHSALAEYQSLQAVPAPSKVIAQIEKGQAEMLRVANGDFKRSEWVAMLKARATHLEEIFKAITKAQEDAKKGIATLGNL